MAKRIWSIVSIALLIFTGCNPKKPAGHAVVSRISVVYETGDGSFQRIYTEQQKMRQILNCLRDLGQQFTPFTDPETLPDRQYSIRVLSSDGSGRFYYVKSDRYIRIDNAPWKQADPERISRLNQLLQTLSPDRTGMGE